MTKKEYEDRFKEIVNWAEKETEKINKKIEVFGMDTNKDKYRKIHDEYQKKLNELKNEYEGSTY